MNIEDNILQVPLNESIKVIYSGHLGCGKSLELYRLHQEIHHRKRYFSIFIDFSNGLNLFQLKTEDFFLVLISEMIRQLKMDKALTIELKLFDEIAQLWLDNQDVKRELSEMYGFTTEIGLKASPSFWQYFQLNGNLTALLSSESKTITTIRRIIKQSGDTLIKSLNRPFEHTRNILVKSGEGKDMIFIVDNSEKMPSEVYKNLFIFEAYLMRELKVNMIFSVPISSFYDIWFSPAAEYFTRMVLPMTKISAETIPILGNIIRKRMDIEMYFEAGVLDYCVKMSGGSPRQLLKIINQAFIKSLGKKITQITAEKSCEYWGQDLWERLNNKHINCLKSGTYQTGENEVKEMLLGFQLLKYNGKITPNPLILMYLAS